MTYEDFVAQKRLSVPPSGISDPPALSPRLFQFQRDLTNWALRRGRAALFCDTGLGKGWMTMEWTRTMSAFSGRPSLILAPLAVSKQFEREAALLGDSVTICASDADVRDGVNVTNYQKIHRFDLERFGSIALDESSLLKSLDGKLRAMLIEQCARIPYKLCATATPSPNDHTELGGHAEFLGIMTHAEMLATFFVQDAGSTADWRLKGHARAEFWKWVASWGAMVKMPSDVGGDDAGYVLPPLVYHEHIVPASREDAARSGMLFAASAETLSEERAARRGTLESRVKLAADICNGIDRQSIVWCGLNDESEALTAAIDGAVEVTGSQDDDDKESRIEAFIARKHKVLTSKARICGFGLNLAQISDVVFCGVSHSFEEFYQAIRRCWRFGQTKPVNVHIVSSELEGRVLENLKSKQRAADEMSSETRRHIGEYVRTAVGARGRDTIQYVDPGAISWPAWLKTEENDGN